MKKRKRLTLATLSVCTVANFSHFFLCPYNSNPLTPTEAANARSIAIPPPTFRIYILPSLCMPGKEQIRRKGGKNCDDDYDYDWLAVGRSFLLILSR